MKTTQKQYILLTPGPLTTSERVKQVMMYDWCTWDNDYNVNIVQNIRKELCAIAQVNPEHYTSVLLQGSGTYCVEAALSCAVSTNDKLLIVANGAYGDRMGEIARYHKLNHTIISLEETVPVTAQIVKEALEKDRSITHVAVVHCETTTGILNPIEAIAPVVKAAGCRFLVDAMSSFGGIEIAVEKLGIDILVSSANKCIQGVPGFGFIILRKEVLTACKGVSKSLSLDIYDQWETMEKGNGKWRFTSPTHVVRAFAEAIAELKEEGGVAARNRRYKANHHTLVEGMKKLGYQPLLDDSLQSPIITSFLYPNDKFSFTDFYYTLKEKGFVIYPGKISKHDTFRIGNIGDVFPKDFEQLIGAIGEITK